VNLGQTIEKDSPSMKVLSFRIPGSLAPNLSHWSARMMSRRSEADALDIVRKLLKNFGCQEESTTDLRDTSDEVTVRNAEEREEIHHACRTEGRDQ
jgi:hypothetical protein